MKLVIISEDDLGKVKDLLQVRNSLVREVAEIVDLNNWELQIYFYNAEDAKIFTELANGVGVKTRFIDVD